MPLSAPAFLTTAAALGVVLGLILLAAHFLRRTGFAQPSGQRLRLQETLALDRARRLHLVSCDGRDFLILAGPSGDAPVGWVTQPNRLAGGTAP